MEVGVFVLQDNIQINLSERNARYDIPEAALGQFQGQMPSLPTSWIQNGCTPDAGGRCVSPLAAHPRRSATSGATRTYLVLGLVSTVFERYLTLGVYGMAKPNMQDGAEDWDNDGGPGIVTVVSGILGGERHGCERDWDRWLTAPGYEITPSLDFTTDLTIRFEFESEEALLYPTTGLLATPGEVDFDYDPIMRFRFLGRTTDDPRAQAILKAEPVETCYAIQDALPAAMLTR